MTEERKMEEVWVELCRKGLNINVDRRVTIGKPDFDIAIQSLSALEIRYQRGLRKIADFFVCSDRDAANSCYQVSHRYLHPSGSITPSDSDKRFTKSLMMAAQATGISFFDHIIIGDNRYFSFADEGLIGQYKAVAVREL